MTPEQACLFAEEHFPKGPEELAAHLEIEVRESELDGCDGYCISLDDTSIIRINSLQSGNRKRFTLAHELGHLILGIPSLLGETFAQMIASDSEEERRVNQLASELLMPTRFVKATLPDLPVVAMGLKRLAKKAKVSELSAAIRACNSAEELGLRNASVVLFNDDDDVTWQWSKTLRIPENTAKSLLAAAREEAPKPFRYKRDEGDVIVASTIENPYFGSATLFVQLLPLEDGMNVSHHERRKELETQLFLDDNGLRNKVSGLMGAHKPRIENMGLEEAVALFWERNQAKLEPTELNSDIGREYVRLRISEWC
ncbi:ImmA/IrrE family metallo-endopeptidase [Planctomycetota bacterium]